ncbi:hypothetical protein FBUS_08419, partial [Fasciolopsis buskii]
EKPIYARRIARPGRKAQKSRKKEPSATDQSVTIYQVLERLREIDQYQRQQKHGSAIRAAESLRQEVSQWSDTFCPNRLEVLANVNSMLGLSYLEMDRLVEALAAHEQAYALGEQCNLPEIVSHATDNIGRVHAKRGDYQEAIDIWSKKLDKTSDEYELIWLSYEIGRCHLELGQSSEALKHGRRALELSEKLDDQAWQLNINVLLGQAYLLLQRKAEAVEAFRVAQQLAKTLDARDAEQAIAQVMDEFDKTDVGLDSDTLANEELSMDRLPVMRESFAFLSIVGSQ